MTTELKTVQMSDKFTKFNLEEKVKYLRTDITYLLNIYNAYVEHLQKYRDEEKPLSYYTKSN